MSLLMDSMPGIEDVLDRFSEQDAEIRRVAVMDLVEVIDEPEALDCVLKASLDTDAGVREEACRVMYEFEGNEIIQALIERLNDESDVVRQTAAETLAENKDKAAAEPLLKVLASATDDFVKASLLHALRELCVPAARDMSIAALEDKSARVRREAVGVLAYLRSEDVLLALIDIARNDPDDEVRRSAVGALVFASNDRVVEALLKAIKDSNWQVREEAALVIAKLKLAQGVDALIEALNDSYWQVCLKAAVGLGKIGDAKAVQPLCEAYMTDISNLRKEVVAALGEIGDAAALPLLEKAAEDPDPDVRKLAAWAIERVSA
jgi:HEAT repeat protein